MNYQLTCSKLATHCNGNFLEVPWKEISISSPFVHSHGQGGLCMHTQVQAAWDEFYLYLRYHCQDDEIIATMTKRDDPLYEEEVVEAFLAPVSIQEYYELNLSPRNVVFDSLIHHDGIYRTNHDSWDCEGLRTGVFRRNIGGQNFGDWDGYLSIPFASLGQAPVSGQIWRVNFFRIKRHDGDQYLAWAPTEAVPANFHVPGKFGTLVFA